MTIAVTIMATPDQGAKLPPWLTTVTSGMVTIPVMPSRVGPKKPVRAYLAAWRRHFRLTGQQVGDRIGVDKGSVSRWENNKRSPKIEILGAYAEALGITVSDLFRPPSEGRSLDAAVAQLPEPQRRRAIEIVEVLIRQAS